MKIYFLKSAPKECYLAFSGGVDSVVLLDLLISKKVDVTLVWVDHNTSWCKQEFEFARETAKKYKLELVCYKINLFDKSTSLECFWSRERNRIFQSLDKKVLVGHTLDDAMEWYVMSAFQGTVKLLDYQNQNVLRPLLTTSKEKILQYANRNDLVYLIDPSNYDSEFNLRNKVRLNLIPEVLNCFPGLRTTVAKLIRRKEFKNA